MQSSSLPFGAGERYCPRRAPNDAPSARKTSAGPTIASPGFIRRRRSNSSKGVSAAPYPLANVLSCRPRSDSSANNRQRSSLRSNYGFSRRVSCGQLSVNCFFRSSAAPARSGANSVRRVRTSEHRKVPVAVRRSACRLASHPALHAKRAAHRRPPRNPRTR